MKRLKMITLLAAGIFFIVGSSEVNAISLSEKIQKNVYVENIDLSDLTKSEAKDKIMEFIDENIELGLNYNNEEIDRLNLNNIGIVYYVDDMINEAYEIGRSGDIIQKFKVKAKLHLGEKKVIKLKYRYDNDKLNHYLLGLEERIYKSPIDAQINLSGNNINITNEKNGIKIDKNKLEKDIVYKIENLECKSKDISTIVLTPKYTHEYLANINEVLGRYETCFNKNKINRVNNIKVAADATSGIILNPQEEFSFNGYVERPEIVSSFKNAPVILNGELIPGLGGGICQVSTTIYNAVLYSGLEITKVQNHSIPSSYAPKGRDATVSSGEMDFRFKNKFNTPIYISNSVVGNRIISTIYGNKHNKRDIEIVTKIEKTIPNSAKVESSMQLLEGEKKLKQKGRYGYKVNTFRIYKGQNQDSEFISQSYYPPFDKITLYGIGKGLAVESEQYGY